MRPYWLGSPNFLHFCGWAGKSCNQCGPNVKRATPSRPTDLPIHYISKFGMFGSKIYGTSMKNLWIPHDSPRWSIRSTSTLPGRMEFWIVGRFHPLVLSQSGYGWKVKTQLPPFPSISQPYRYAAAPFCPPQDLFEGVLEERRLCRSCGLVRVPWRQHFSEKVQWWLNLTVVEYNGDIMGII